MASRSAPPFGDAADQFGQQDLIGITLPRPDRQATGGNFAGRAFPAVLAEPAQNRIGRTRGQFHLVDGLDRGQTGRRPLAHARTRFDIPGHRITRRNSLWISIIRRQACAASAPLFF